MHRRGGLAALERQKQSSASYSQLSSTITATQLASFQTQLTQFRSALIHFANTHRKTIASDPAFRSQFQQMCANIGVDPLAGPKRAGWWAESLGFVGDWTFELGVQIVDICVSTRELNGGIIDMPELIRLLSKLRGVPANGAGGITEEDVIRSIKVLEPLGSGYEVLDLGQGRKAVRSVVRELDNDQAAVIGLAGDGAGFVTESTLVSAYQWSRERARAVLENCTMRDGICWIDDQDEGEVRYWVPATMQWDE